MTNITECELLPCFQKHLSYFYLHLICKRVTYTSQDIALCNFFFCEHFIGSHLYGSLGAVAYAGRAFTGSAAVRKFYAMCKSCCKNVLSRLGLNVVFTVPVLDFYLVRFIV